MSIVAVALGSFGIIKIFRNLEALSKKMPEAFIDHFSLAEPAKIARH